MTDHVKCMYLRHGLLDAYCYIIMTATNVSEKELLDCLKQREGELSGACEKSHPSQESGQRSQPKDEGKVVMGHREPKGQ